MIHKMFSLSLLQEGKRLKNTRINLQNEDSTINAFNTPEVCGIHLEFLKQKLVLFAIRVFIYVIIIFLDIIFEGVKK